MTTHHDLLVRIDADFNRAYQLTLSKELEKIICRNLKSLRAVVELHKPITTYDGLISCYCISNDEDSYWDRPYPCPTIQAIEEQMK